MFAGTASRLVRSDSTAAAPLFAPNALALAPAPRGGVIWITGVAGVARTGLVDLVRTRVESWWHVDVITPEQLTTWIDDSDGRVAIVVAQVLSAPAAARARAAAADVAFVEILAVSDWDALVERTDSRLFEHLAAFFSHVGHAPKSKPRRTDPDAIVRVDWHGPEQIGTRVSAALQRAGLVSG